MYRVIQSPQLLKLASSLGTLLREQSPEDPFQPVEVIVANRDTARWLKLVLAEQCGIAANIHFLLPSEWLWTRIRECWPEVEQQLPSDRGPMTWSIYSILTDPEQLSRYPDLEYWIERQGGVHSDTVRQLSGQISSVFDQYQVYRPWMLHDWEKASGGQGVSAGKPTEQMRGSAGDDRYRAAAGEQLNLLDPLQGLPLEMSQEPPDRYDRSDGQPGAPMSGNGATGEGREWQKRLWIALKQRWNQLPEETREDRAALYRRLYEMVGRRLGADRPIILFNSGLLPPPVSQLLQRLSRSTTILHYRISSITRGTAELTEDSAPRLLMNFIGEQREQDRQFTTYLRRHPGNLTVESLSPEFGRESNLSIIQSAFTRGETIPSLSTNDDSIVITSCHSPLREVETLHQFLLEKFSEQADLTPDDVLVVTPDLETYAPFVEAVFSTVEEGLPAIPWYCGMNTRRSSGSKGFLRLLHLSGSRLKREELLDFLEQPAVSDRFGFSSADRHRISRWIRESGVTWGLDGEHRSEYGLPAEEHQSWREAMRRGWLGQLIPDRAGTQYRGLLLNPDITSTEERLLWSRLQELLDLMALVRRAAGRRETASGWQRALQKWVQLFLPESHHYESDRAELLDAIDEVTLEIERGGYDGELSFPLITQELSDAIQSGSSRTSRFDRGVLFNSMVPVRSLPFRVIALLGLNDDTFPRKPVHPEFDLMASDPRPDERDRKREDRNLFLESVMAAGMIHYSSYTGRNLNDDEPIPPSPVLGEWIDTVAESMNRPVDSIVETQRLNGFSQSLFTAGSPRSFSGVSLQAARNASANRGIRGLDIDRKLPEPDEGGQIILLDDLERFFNNPSGSFFRQRLDISIRSSGLDASQEFDLDPLSAHQLFSRVFYWLVNGMGEQEAEKLLLMSGQLPADLPGEHLAQEIVEQAGSSLLMVKERGIEPVTEQIPVDIMVDKWRVKGVFQSRSRTTPFEIFLSSLSGRRLMRGWIRHLIRCLISPESEPETLLLFNSRKRSEWCIYRYEPMAQEQLTRLIRRYRNGMCSPVNLYMESAFSYYQNLDKGEERAIGMALKTWSDDFSFPERADIYLELLLGREAEADREQIREFAEELYAPIFKRLEVGR